MEPMRVDIDYAAAAAVGDTIHPCWYNTPLVVRFSGCPDSGSDAGAAAGGGSAGGRRRHGRTRPSGTVQQRQPGAVRTVRNAATAAALGLVSTNAAPAARDVLGSVFNGTSPEVLGYLVHRPALSCDQPVQRSARSSYELEHGPVLLCYKGAIPSTGLSCHCTNEQIRTCAAALSEYQPW